MKYIIMSDGKGTRWNNYLGITKQEIIVKGERLIDRTTRMISERTSDKIFILSGNQKHENPLSTRIISKYDEYYHKKYAYDFIDDSITYLYGDTFYSEELIDTILEDKCVNICFYGNENAIIAVKVINYKLLKEVIDHADSNSHSLYHLFDGLDEYRIFKNIGNGFVNINTPSDYNSLINNEKKLILKRK